MSHLTTETVRLGYMENWSEWGERNDIASGAEFDRWLESVKKEAVEDVVSALVKKLVAQPKWSS